MATLLLKQLLTVEEIEKLASRSNLRFGKQILKDAKIVITNTNVFRRVATVTYKNNPSQTVDLLSTNKGLRYTCTCTSRKNMFCEHAIAVGLAMHE